MPVTLNLTWVFCLSELSKKLLELASLASLNRKHRETDGCLLG